MNETTAREVLLLQAFETTRPPSTLWGPDDAQWATRLAKADVPSGATAEDFVVLRARHAMTRLRLREAKVDVWLGTGAWHPIWVWGAALVGAVAGVWVDSIGANQRINLLAPPLWGVVAWNLVVYAAVAAHALSARARTGALAAPRGLGLARAMRRVARWFARREASPSSDRTSAVVQSYGRLCWQHGSDLVRLRAVMVLHCGAAAIAIGLIGGMYLRGLVLDYRAYWESTFLSAPTVHAFLALVLAPAATLSGLDIPTVGVLESMRARGGDGLGAPAAPWIHLLALTLFVFVVVPRAALAVHGARRAAARARRIELPWHDPYVQRLAREFLGVAARVSVLPYAHVLSDAARERLSAILGPVVGQDSAPRIEPTQPYGLDPAEAFAQQTWTEPSLAIVLFDLAATPEPENHGRFAQRAAGTFTTAIVMVDEAGFRYRFASDAQRMSERREHWREFAHALGTSPVFVNLTAANEDAASDDFRRALQSPVHAAAA